MKQWPGHSANTKARTKENHLRIHEDTDCTFLGHVPNDTTDNDGTYSRGITVQQKSKNQTQPSPAVSGEEGGSKAAAAEVEP